MKGQRRHKAREHHKLIPVATESILSVLISDFWKQMIVVRDI